MRGSVLRLAAAFILLILARYLDMTTGQIILWYVLTAAALGLAFMAGLRAMIALGKEEVLDIRRGPKWGRHRG